MFKTRTLVALGLLLAVVAIVLVKSGKQRPHTGEVGKTAAAAEAPKIDTGFVDGIEIVQKDKPAVTLLKQGEAWQLTAPVADRADQKAVEAMLKAVAEAQWKRVIAESKQSHDSLKVGDEQVVKVTLRRGSETLASLWIGETGKVRVNGEDRVWDVGKLSRFVFVKEAKLWRHRELFRLEKDQVDRLELEWLEGGAREKVVARRQPGAPAAEGQPPKPDSWLIVEGADAVGGAIDETVPGNALSTLSRLDIAEFADEATAEQAGLLAPRARVAAVLTDGTRKAIEIGAAAGEQDVYARVEGETRIFKLRKGTAEALAKPPLQWRDKTLAKIDGKEVTRLEVVTGKQRAVYERVDDKTWKAVEPAGLTELDQGKVAGLAASFANLRAQRLLLLAPAEEKAAFAEPAGSVTVKAKDGRAITLTVGTTVEIDKARLTHVRLAGRKEVFLVPELTAQRWIKGADEMKPSPVEARQPPIDPHAH